MIIFFICFAQYLQKAPKILRRPCALRTAPLSVKRHPGVCQLTSVFSVVPPGPRPPSRTGQDFRWVMREQCEFWKTPGQDSRRGQKEKGASPGGTPTQHARWWRRPQSPALPADQRRLRKGRLGGPPGPPAARSLSRRAALPRGQCRSRRHPHCLQGFRGAIEPLCLSASSVK